MSWVASKDEVASLLGYRHWADVKVEAEADVDLSRAVVNYCAHCQLMAGIALLQAAMAFLPVLEGCISGVVSVGLSLGLSFQSIRQSFLPRDCDGSSIVEVR